MNKGERITIGYIRVSTENQAKEGYSLDYQKEKIELKCQIKDIEKFKIIEDAGKSAKNLNRPGMNSIMGAIKLGKVENLIVLKLDRLTRSIKDLELLVELCGKYSVNLISVQEDFNLSSAQGRLFLYIQGLFAQFEREQISERTKAGMISKAKKGEYPFGFRPALGLKKDEKTHKLKKDEKELLILKKIHYLYCKKNYSESKVSQIIKKEFDYDISEKYILELLTKPIYKGIVTIGDEDVKIIEPIFNQQEIDDIENRRKLNFFLKHEYKYLNKIYINGKLAEHETKSKNNNKYVYYKIRDRKNKKTISINEKIIDDFIEKEKMKKIDDLKKKNLQKFEKLITLYFENHLEDIEFFNKINKLKKKDIVGVKYINFSIDKELEKIKFI